MEDIDCDYDGCTHRISRDQNDTLIAALVLKHLEFHKRTTPLGEKPEPIKRPTISSDGTAKQWTNFIKRWRCYVQYTKVKGPQQVIQLLECCDETLRDNLLQYAKSDLQNEPMDAVLEIIKKMAIRSESAMVAKVNFHGMRQGPGESIRAFCARLRGQADSCSYVLTQQCDCGCRHNVTVDYSEQHVADMLCIGMEDPDIKQALMSDLAHNKTVDQTLQFIEARDEARRSAPKLSAPQEVEALSSSYRRQKKPAQGDRPTHDQPTQCDRYPPDEQCSYCGGPGHGRNAPTRVRRTRCPAFGKDCKSCGKANHMARVCRGDTTKHNSQHENAIFNA